MKFFRLITSGIDVASLLVEIQAQEDAWLVNTSRQETIHVQRETNTIFLRNAVQRQDMHINENQESLPTKISEQFPRAMYFMTKTASILNATLSRATIVRLKPKSQVGRHIDVGSYYLIRDRYHLVLRSASGSVLTSGDEAARMREGELWWFDNKQHHAAFNESDEWRIHYIFDLLPHAHVKLAINPLPPSVQPQEGASANLSKA
ncbi:Aspartyl/Asparaginyl beta-hydroxylase [Rhizobiales bacterium GAS113]|nr:Aspartyl/Asparaginyl beta-hydroxylase [Rhizobiales bacterium GAS113]SEB90515.1 Aspartyl/Asparaginyl beta-hydroxylase [Rhizobiales bacterium GAS188]